MKIDAIQRKGHAVLDTADRLRVKEGTGDLTVPVWKGQADVGVDHIALRTESVETNLTAESAEIENSSHSGLTLLLYY